MALSRIDETELLLPLYAGVRDEPHWDVFLTRLRQRARADAVHLAISPFAATLPPPLPEIAPDRLRPDRVYAAAELEEAPPGDMRIMRVAEPGGASAVLAVSSETREFAAADSALLSAIAPHLAVALAGLAQAERQRLRLAIAEDGLARGGTGWIAFDSEARVIDCDAVAARAVAPVPGQRLRIGDAEIERTLATLAATPDAPARAIVLSASPRLEALLIAPPAAPPSGATQVPAMIALLRTPPTAGGAARVAAVAAHSEARLAIALCDGTSIAEAAEEIGLTIETARNYSKRLYAKTGARGQADLVRLLLSGGSALASHPAEL